MEKFKYIGADIGEIYRRKIRVFQTTQLVQLIKQPIYFYLIYF